MSAWLERLVYWLWEMFLSVVDYLLTPGDAMVGYIKSLFPPLAANLAPLQPYVKFLDLWIDTYLCFLCISAYFTFYVAITSYKVAKSWIPTVSGS